MKGVNNRTQIYWPCLKWREGMLTKSTVFRIIVLIKVTAICWHFFFCGIHKDGPWETERGLFFFLFSFFIIAGISESTLVFILREPDPFPFLHLLTCTCTVLWQLVTWRQLLCWVFACTSLFVQSVHSFGCTGCMYWSNNSFVISCTKCDSYCEIRLASAFGPHCNRTVVEPIF